MTAGVVFTAQRSCLWADMVLPVQVILFVRSWGLGEVGWTHSKLEDLYKLAAVSHSMVQSMFFATGDGDTFSSYLVRAQGQSLFALSFYL